MSLKIKQLLYGRMSRLKENLKKLPREFFIDSQFSFRVIWLLNRQKPSAGEPSYDFNEERLGLSEDGKVVWGFHSGCS